MRTLALVALVTLAMSSVTSCTPDEAECASALDCGEAREAAPCERCPEPTTAFCVEGVCEERADDAVAVSATFLIARALDGVNGMAWALALDDRACDPLALVEAGAFPADLNVLAAGQKTLTGGDRHEDVALASVPEGAVLVMALATAGAAGDGAVLGAGCAQETAAAPSLAVAEIDLVGPE